MADQIWCVVDVEPLATGSVICRTFYNLRKLTPITAIVDRRWHEQHVEPLPTGDESKHSAISVHMASGESCSRMQAA